MAYRTSKVASTLIFLLPAPAALAADASTSAVEELPAISVTARGYEAELLQTPQSVELLDPQATDSSQPVGALFRGEPGLAVQSDGAWGQNPVIRGLKKESIVMLVDGVRLNSAQPQGALASMIDTGLLEQAEVVKGPSSVLYGSGAMGGAVNLRTPEVGFSRTPSHDSRVSLTGGSVDHGLAGAGVYRYSGKDHALVMGLAARDHDDYRSPEGRVERSGYRSQSGLFKYAFRASEDTRLKLNLQHHRDEDVWYPGSARTGGQPGGAGLPPILGKVTMRSPKQHRTLAEAGIEQDVGAGQFSAEIYRQEVFRQIRAFSENLDRDRVRNDVTFATEGLRARHLFPVGDNHLMTVGVEGWQMKADPERYIDQPPTFEVDNQTRRSPFRDGEIESLGVFAQDEWMLGDTTIIAGARFDRVTGSASQKGFGPAAQTSGLEKSDNTFSWSLGAIHEFSDLVNPYVNLGQAYRAADMRERFEDAARGDGYFHTGNPQLDPERSLSVEAGIKGRGERLDYQLAASYTRIDNYIAGRITGENHGGTGLPIKRTENLDEVSIYGIEGHVAAPLGFGVADLGFTWLRGHNHQDNEPLAEMPPPEVTAGFGQPADRGLHWRASLRAVAGQDRVGTRFTNGAENTTAGFATADLLVGWKHGRVGNLSDVSVELQLNNLFDRRYHEHLAEGLSGQEIASPGRGATLSLTARF